jgi:hypothetical protein
LKSLDFLTSSPDKITAARRITPTTADFCVINQALSGRFENAPVPSTAPVDFRSSFSMRLAVLLAKSIT